MVAAVRRRGKTEFVKDVLTKNPQANPQVVNDAWNEAGHDGQISVTLVQKMRSEMGLTGNLALGRKAAGSRVTSRVQGRAEAPKAKGRPRTRMNGTHEEAAAILRPTRTTSRTNSHLAEELEGEIDRLIFKIMGLGGLSEVEEILRRARRLVVRSHQG